MRLHRFRKAISFALVLCLCLSCTGNLLSTRADAAGTVSYWAQEGCKASVKDGVISKQALNYDPQGNIERLEFASIMANVFQSVSDTEQSDGQTEEKDKSIDELYYEWIYGSTKSRPLFDAYEKAGSNFTDTKNRLANALYELGLVSGSNSKFNPTWNITRQEICVMFYNMFKYFKENDYAVTKSVTDSMTSVDVDSILANFEDASEISSWSRRAVAFMVQNGFMSGSTVDGKLYIKPKASCTREQAAILGYNIEKQYSTTGNTEFIWKESTLYKTECETWYDVVAVFTDSDPEFASGIRICEYNYRNEIMKRLKYTYLDPDDLYYELVKGYQTNKKEKGLFDAAWKVVGTPYVWSGSTPEEGFDCSGFVCWCINNSGNGWNVGRTTAEGLKSYCTTVKASQLQPGDIIFFNNENGYAYHCAIYLGHAQWAETGYYLSYVNIRNYTFDEFVYGKGNGYLNDKDFTFGHLKQY